MASFHVVQCFRSQMVFGFCAVVFAIWSIHLGFLVLGRRTRFPEFRSRDPPYDNRVGNGRSRSSVGTTCPSRSVHGAMRMGYQKSPRIHLLFKEVLCPPKMEPEVLSHRTALSEIQPKKTFSHSKSGCDSAIPRIKPECHGRALIGSSRSRQW
jgi:hypothetical protein